jgi:hypothetical protein
MSPLFMAVAGLLSIPGSIVADYVFHDTTLRPWAFCGLALVVTGFSAFAAPTAVEHAPCLSAEQRRALGRPIAGSGVARVSCV